MYYRSKNYYLFLFTLVNESDKFERKHAYFFIRKTIKQVEDLGLDNSLSLITQDQDVYIIKDNDMLGSDEVVHKKYIQQALFRELLEIQKDKQDHHINLTFETLYDMRTPLEFMPFIYQEKKSLATHHMLLLDINSMQISGSECINSNLEIRRFLRKSQAGFAMYTLTRTSDVYT